MKVGVIIARFQVAELHDGHKYLIRKVIEKCEHLIILLGCKKEPDEKNILSFAVRSGMLEEWIETSFPGLSWRVLPIHDHREDNAMWSYNVDDAIVDGALGRVEEVMLYGSRDSFHSYYTGRFPYEEIPPLEGYSGTEERNKYTENCNDVDFRKGIVHGFNLYRKYLIDNQQK